MLDLLSLLFPITCFGCGQSGIYLCPLCIQTKIDFHPTQKCAICNRPSPNGQTHSRCFTPYSIDGVFALTHKNLLITKLLKQLKYRRSYHVTQAFTPIISQTPIRFQKFDLIIPIPLHPQRLRERGFNQSELLAQLFSNQLKIPINNQILIRTHTNTPQADIHDRETRIKNLKGVFSLSPKIDKKTLLSQQILLIDDVSTTGATLYQAALPIKRSGATLVWGLVIAR